MDADGGDDVEGAIRRITGPTPHLGLSYDGGAATLWVTFAPRPRPCFTPELIHSFVAVQDAVASLWGRAYPSRAQPVKFAVVRSDWPGIFSSGGDLSLILSRIEAGDREGLRRYGHAGTRACHGLVSGFGACVTTVALVQGQAVGSGFEAARCCDVVVAEEGSAFLLPEAKFGLFPGNGAVSVLGRRLGPALLRRMVLEGVGLGAGEARGAGALDALAAGAVDRLAPKGEGEATVRAMIAGMTPSHAAGVALSHGAARADGITLAAMLSETDRWVDAAVEALVDPGPMRRIVSLQARRFAPRTGTPTCP